MRKFLILIALLGLITMSCVNEKLQKDIVTVLNIEVSKVSFAEASEIKDIDHYLFVLKEQDELKIINKNDVVVKEMINKEQNISLKNDRKQSEYLIHYSDIYKYNDIYFLCIAKNSYHLKEKYLNNYDEYWGYSKRAILLLNEDFKVINSYEWETQIEP